MAVLGCKRSRACRCINRLSSKHELSQPGVEISNEVVVLRTSYVE
jgi:hypothetical protein